MKKVLERFGKVEQCEEKDGMLHIKITKGFNKDAKNTFECADKIMKLTDNKFPIVHKFITDSDFFHLILKPSK